MTTTVDQRDLVKCVRKFRALDDELKTVNTRASKLREDKKFVESEMSDILKRTAFQSVNKLEIQDDGSFIKVQRPETWNKPWSLGARDLQTMLDDYFRTPGPHTSAACNTYIVNRKKKDMVAKEFAFKRIVNVDDNNDDARSEVGSSRHA
jgi:predicted nuclease with TOPRIM domain